jgi:5-methylcytosine-specific restriction endonuclease McrA
MPVNYTKYPSNWHEQIRPAVLKRARFRCEGCGLRQRLWVFREKNGTLTEADDFMCDWARRNGLKPYRIHLAVSHKDHDVSNNSLDNLQALCQSCHLANDKSHHQEQKLLNRANRALKPSEEWKKKISNK